MAPLAEHVKFDSFGQPVDGTAPLADFSRGQAGMYYDQITGLYKAGARWNDPKAGVWLSEDPSGFAAGDPNLYRLMGNNLPRYTDPSGLCSNSIGKYTGFSYDVFGNRQNYYGVPNLPSSNNTVYAPPAATMSGLAPLTFSAETTVSAGVGSIGISSAFVGPTLLRSKWIRLGRATCWRTTNDRRCDRGGCGKCSGGCRRCCGGRNAWWFYASLTPRNARRRRTGNIRR